MSNTNGQVSFVKSMNGILSFNTGSGTIISGNTVSTGVVACTELDCPQINVDKIESYTVGANVSLYTELVGGSIHIGNAATQITVDAPITIGTEDVSVLNASTINASTINTNTINSFDTALPSYLFPNALTDVSIADGLTSGILSMGSLLQYGEIKIGGHNNFGGSINIGREMLNGTIRIASNCVNTSIYFGHDGNSGTVNFNTNTTLNLGPYSKTLNIGTNQFNATDRINIGNGLTGSAGMNIQSKGTINIGLSATAIQIGNFMLFGGVGINIGNSAVLTNINGSTLNVGSNATTLNVGTAQTIVGSSVNIGTNTMTTNLKGVVINLGTDTGIANTINLGNSSTTLIVVGTNSGSGNITLRTLGALSLGNSASIIELGTGTSIANTITIGNASSTVNILGSASITGNTYTATAVGSTVNLFNNITTGSLNMATGITNGNILIGNHNAIGATGSLTLRAKNSVEIGSAAASIYLGIGSPSINIGNSIVGGTPIIDIGTAAFSTININGKFGKAITPTYGYTAFVGTPAGCIGNFFAPSSAITANFTLVSGTNKVGGIFANIPIGVWMLYWNCAVFSPTTTASLTSITLMMGTTSGGADLFSGVVDVGNVPVGITKTYLITQIYSNIAATTDLYFSITAVFGGTLSLLPLYAVKDCKVLRIA